MARGSATRSGWLHTAVGAAIVGVLLFPLYWMINASVQPSSQLLKTPPAWWPFSGTLDGYREALNTQTPHLLTSLVVACLTVVVTLAIAAPAAYALARFNLRGLTAVVFAMLVVQMLPGIVMANALFTLFNHARLLNTYAGLVLADCTLTVPFAVLILRAFMLSIPRELTEAALVDGAGMWRTFLSIIVPVSRNSLITAGLFAFLFAWADFLFALTLTTRETIMPITVGIYRFVGAQASDWNGVMATGVLASIPAAVLLIIAQKYIAAGIAGGSVKN